MTGGRGRDLFTQAADRPTAYSVSELVSTLKEAVESALGSVWVKGEITGFKAYQSGHWYFSLRDELSQIRCVMWKGNAQRVGAQPAEGTEVYLQGAPTVWGERGELRLAVTTLLPTSAIGLQRLNRERVQAALQKDGLLDPARKRPLPAFPRVIAVVTSPDGAALRDIITVARKRWPRIHLLVVPTKVQGDGAPAELVRALGTVNRLAGVDLCIVGRGGGSKEDLLAFDDEGVCRAVAAVRVPVISAVGHETDLALTDLVADVRAPTPSAAVELALPDRLEILHRVDGLARRLAGGLRRPTLLVEERLARSGDRMQAALTRRLEGLRGDLDRYAAQLDAYSPLQVLRRGYSVARLPDRRVVRRVSDLGPGAPFTLQLADGELPARREDR